MKGYFVAKLASFLQIVDFTPILYANFSWTASLKYVSSYGPGIDYVQQELAISERDNTDRSIQNVFVTVSSMSPKSMRQACTVCQMGVVIDSPRELISHSLIIVVFFLQNFIPTLQAT